MENVPPGYGSSRLSSIEVWHHPDEGRDLLREFASLLAGLVADIEIEVRHALGCALGLCVYRTNDDARAALARPVPPTMLMAPRIAPDLSLIVCHSPAADPRNGDPSRMRRHFAHEIAHVVLADRTGGRRTLGDGGRLAKVRPWVDEGFAEVVAAVVCRRPDLVAPHMAAAEPWDEDELDAVLNDVGSLRRAAAFAEAVRRFELFRGGRSLGDLFLDPAIVGSSVGERSGRRPLRNEPRTC